MPLINYALKDPADILPWGMEPNTNMHWFGLTDGQYWLSVGDKTLFEYTLEIAQQWGVPGLPYTDYFIVRFLEDFSNLFTVITESIPEEFYRIAKTHRSLYDFYGKASIWLDQFPDDEDADFDLYYDKYDKVIQWIYSRTLSSLHLNKGPYISFFRCQDRLSIVWQSNLQDESGTPVWTAGNGEIEMPYQLFIEEVRGWGRHFFNSMEDQIDRALHRDWGTTQLDKDRLKKEQEERRREFADDSNQLSTEPQNTTDWLLVKTLIREMALGK
jgi:hypothetical protein